MKKGAWLVLVICLCCLLSGCCLKHDWQAATCTAPETCAKCGETRGEALGHDWQAATCTAPETCAKCGETRGEALGHDWQAATCTAPETCAKCGETQGEALGHQWTEANYQAPETCAVCGETRGEALTPDFEAHGLTCNMELGKTYDYLTACHDPSYTTVGQATVTEYEALSPPPERETIDGYEWRKVTIEIVFSDENSNAYGETVAICTEDYYDIEGLDESTERFDDSTTTFAVDWNGQRYDQCFCTRASAGFGARTDGQCVFTAHYEYRVPVGYDGSVIGLYNQGLSWEEEDHIYDVADADSLFFRLMPIN